jgi:myo-inositol-1-phosphate synthase
MNRLRRGSAILPATGKLGILSVGLGAVSTTMLAGGFAARRNLARPLGSLTQTGKIRLGKRTAMRMTPIREFVPLTSMDDLVFGGWDLFQGNALTRAREAAVLETRHLDMVADDLQAIEAWSAVSDSKFTRMLQGDHLKQGRDKLDLAEQVQTDIESFRKQHSVERLVMCWAASTEAYHPFSAVHQSLAAFEAGLKRNDPDIAPSQIYAYAALSQKIPFINGAPQPSSECPALLELAQVNQAPICGKDFKTGQTLMKTIVAPGLLSRVLGVSGWFSTNILGNRDGEVLDDPEAFRSKEISKLSVLESILDKEVYPELYQDLYHKVRINYYPPRGDNKESWDNIDIFGWMDYPMQIKINFLCRDSILAAPVMLDLILFSDLAQRAAMFGIQEWLSFYFKAPLALAGLKPENDLFKQRAKLENTLRFLMKEELIHHTGLNYYYNIEE